MRLLARITLLVLLAGAIAGCSADASQSPAATTASAGAVTASTAPASVAPSGAASAPLGSSGLTVAHDDPALEAKLPDRVGGEVLTKVSVGPISSAGNAGAEPIKALAREIGDGSGNFGLAIAYSPTDQTFTLSALWIPGAPSAELLRGFTALALADTAGGTSDSATIAGKTVTHLAAPGNPIGDTWFYAKGDTLYSVQAGSADDAEELLALLP